VAQEPGNARLRLLLPPDGAARLERAPLPAPLPGPVRVAVSPAPADSRDPARYHKTTARSFYESRRSARPDCFDVILLDEAGRPTEATIANLVAELDGVRVTPPLTAGLLPGVFRAELLATGQVRERSLTLAELRGARRLWLVNALRGWMEASLDPTP
jgi:para-aminobenzoate synthetase / 4-amino-4-deoxychorismate lyase